MVAGAGIGFATFAFRGGCGSLKPQYLCSGMSKAVWTILVLVMASFTGCLDSTDDVEPEGQDDASNQQQSSGGNGGDNDTEDDDIFLQALQNLTSRINDLSNKTQDLIDENELLRESVEALTSENEELQDAMTNLEFYQYDAPASSVVYIYSLHTNETGIPVNATENPINYNFNLEKLYKITKENNTITIEHVGRATTGVNFGLLPDSPSNCTTGPWNGFSFLNGDGSVIMDYPNGVFSFMMGRAEIFAECEIEEEYQNNPFWRNSGDYYWSKIIVELPEEPDRFTYGDELYTFV